jgi:hypothetical protein
MLPSDSQEVFRQSLIEALLVRYYEPPEEIPVNLCKLVARLDAQDDERFDRGYVEQPMGRAR